MAEIFLDCTKTYTPVPDAQKFTMHTHSTYELYCFLSGDAQYYVEGMVYGLSAGDILLMKRSEAHSLLIRRPFPYERIVVNFGAGAILAPYREQICAFLDDRPLGRDNKYSDAKNSAIRQHYLEKIRTAEDMEEKCLYLTVILRELMDARGSPPQTDETSVADILGYINANLTEDLSLQDLCARFYIGKAQLNRKFRHTVGTTVWNYISTKRLLWAKACLQNGEMPTKVYKKCGFNDYCTFFKAYKAKFGVSPKTDCEKK